MAFSRSVFRLIKLLRSNSGPNLFPYFSYCTLSILRQSVACLAGESGTLLIKKKILPGQSLHRKSCFYFDPLNPLGNKYYRTAEVACSVEDDGVLSNTEGEGSLNSKQKKAGSFQKSVEDLDDEIQKLTKKRNIKLALLEQLKAQELEIQGPSFQVKMEKSDTTPVSHSLAKKNLKHSKVEKIQRKTWNATVRESPDDGTNSSHVAPVSLDVSNLVEEITRPAKLEKKRSSQQYTDLGGNIKADDGSLVGMGRMNVESGGANITGKMRTSTERKSSQTGEEGGHIGKRESTRVKENKQETGDTQSFQEEVHDVALEVSGTFEQTATKNSDWKSAATCDLYATETIKENETKIDGPNFASKMPQLQHPWPEWILFLEKLSEKNYFSQAAESEHEGEFNTLTLIKHAVVAFGRNRDDIFRFLPRKDLRVIANFGCPGMERKAVNSCKRLRAFFYIPEGDVCEQCKMKNSCTRAFLKPVSQAPAGTLDVVRALFSYSIHAVPDAECYISYPKQVKQSICNILKKIVELNALPRDPNLPKLGARERFSGSRPSEKTMQRITWKCPRKVFSEAI